MMKVLRGLGAALVWLLATVVMIVAAVLCVTVILLPLGLPLMALGLRLYGYGVQILVPGAPEVKRGLRKRLGLRARGDVRGDVKRAGKRGEKSGRKLRKKAGGHHTAGHDLVVAVHRTDAWRRRATAVRRLAARRMVAVFLGYRLSTAAAEGVTMPDDSLGNKLGRQVKSIKGGLKDVAHKLTEADPEPRTDAMAGRINSSKAQERTPSKDELYADAKRLGIKGRSKMTKEELLRAVRRA